MEEELAWLDKYLFQNPTDDDGGLKPNSPLAIALKLKGAKADGARYGQIKNGKLIPETVAHGDLEVGRFEVTRAQFAQFDKSYAVATGHENFPANGITFDQAKAYCAWLSKTTGDSYRLPNSSEAGSLYSESSGAENTLDYWVGGAVNPDDAEKFQIKVRELGSQAPLLKEVGSFKANGSDEPIFDLGGNVAEWTMAADGAGQVSGGSADTPADQKISSRHPGSEYVGLRVVKEAARTLPPR
jgi:formylglycine-generating enzyme required for sulfatase activity